MERHITDNHQFMGSFMCRVNDTSEGCIPCEFITQEVTVHFHGREDVIADLLQELAVLGEGLWVGVAAFVCTELQQN